MPPDTDTGRMREIGSEERMKVVRQKKRLERWAIG